MSHHRMVSPWLATRKWKEAQGWANEAAKSGDTQACGCGYGLDPGAALSCRWGERGNRWDHATGEEVRGKKYTDMEACNLGGNLFNNTTTPFTTIIYFFWISQPMHGFSLWRQQNERKKIIKKKKQQMYNWSFVRLPYCVFLSDISWCVWDSSIFLFAFCVCPLKLTEASCIKGDERSCSNCVGLGVLLGWGSVVVLWIVLAREKDLLVSTVCS